MRNGNADLLENQHRGYHSSDDRESQKAHVEVVHWQKPVSCLMATD